MFKDLEPAYKALETIFTAIRIETQHYSDSVYALFDVSRAYYETDANGVRCAWHDPSGPDPINHPVPYRKNVEWKKYRAWVWSLPETHRSVEAGRTLDEVALVLLYDEPEDFEP